MMDFSGGCSATFSNGMIPLLWLSQFCVSFAWAALLCPGWLSLWLLVYLYRQRPVPTTQSLCGWMMSGSQWDLRHQLTNLASTTEILNWFKPHTSEYMHFHLVDRSKARCLRAAMALVPIMPSTENMSGVKCWWHAIVFRLLLVFMTLEDILQIC